MGGNACDLYKAREREWTFVYFLQLHSSPFVLTITKKSEKIFMKVVRKKEQNRGKEGLSM